MSESTIMHFQRVGRTHQLLVRSTEDLRHVLTLDKAHWVATGAPLEALKLDYQFLRYVDTDSNDRIMCFEIREAIRWTLDHLTDTSGIDAASTTLKLATVRRDTPDGERICLAAEKLLRQQGRRDAAELDLETIRGVKSQIESRPVSEAGVILPEAVQDPAARAFLEDVVATVGGVDHPTGKPGVDQDKLDAFQKSATSFLEWVAKSDLPEGAATNPIQPFGQETGERYKLLCELKPKIEQFFAQCLAIAMDERAAGHIHPIEEDLKAADFGDPKAIREFMRQAPLAPPNAMGTLDINGRLNPAYADVLIRLRDKLVVPILGNDTGALTADGWQEIRNRFSAHGQWLASKAGAEVESLPPDKLRTYLDPELHKQVEQLISRSKRTAIALDNIRLLEKLVLSQAYLLKLINNFVSFPYLYDPDQRASFEMGTLTIDGRHLTFAIEAANRGEHAKVAHSSDIFVVYAEVLEQDGSVRCTVALPVTSGGKGNLVVGKRGVFQTIEGKEYDARVVQILSNPISLSETLVAPFQRLGKLLTNRIESMTAAAEKKLDQTTTQALDGAAAAPPPPAESSSGSSRGLFAGGMLMGGGVAVAALTSAVAYISSTVARVGIFKVLGGVLIAVLAVAVPASLVAVLKLRRRDLSSILEGSGWAINARMRLTFKQGCVFTCRPPYPKGARGVQRTWKVVLLVILLLWLLSHLSLQLSSRMRREAKARKAATVSTQTSKTEPAKP